MLEIDSIYSMDKDLQYSTQDDTDYQDLFDQFFNDEPTPINSTALDQPKDHHAFDPSFEETEPSESSSAGSKGVIFPSPSSSSRQTPNQQTFALPTQRMLAQPKPQRAAITSHELLNLEGKAPELVPVKSPSPPGKSTAPSLRSEKRSVTKEKAPRGREHDMNQAYTNVHSNGLYNQDWTSQFEQISLRQSVSHLQTPSPRPTPTYKNKRPGNIQTAVHTPSNTPSQDRLPITASSQSQRPSVASDISQSSQMIPVALSPTIRAAQSNDEISPMSLSQDQRARLNVPHLRHVDTWACSPISPLTDNPITPNYVVSPAQIQQNWYHSLPASNLESFSFNNHGNSTPQSSSALHPHNLMQFDPSNPYSPEDPSTACSVPSDNSFTIPPAPMEDFLNNSPYKHQRNQTTSALHSTTPPSTSPLHSPTKTPPQPRLRKSRHRSQKSLSNLRAPKSASSLKSTAATTTTNSPSKSHHSHHHHHQSSHHHYNHPLRNAKSTSSTSGTNFGFVNFTPEDRGKILTGVAPSGSSKTKARRELEAMEKKRRSSAAALRAVEAMGGDVERFRREVVEGLGGEDGGVEMGEI